VDDVVNVNNKLSNVLILVKIRPVNLGEIADRHKYEAEVLRAL